ncbi:MAG: hypothetical protein HW406_2388 [Candidatus Brocadiaceae bacterium]|nr:hypothetical protein [Candidatus Brocadiaceae bacterium]
MVMSDKGEPSVWVTLPTIFPLPADAFRCPSVSINLFVKCNSTGFWLVGEDAHDDQEQNITTAISVPVKNRYFFTGIINSPFNVYEDLNNLQIVKVKLPHFSMMCQTQFDDLKIMLQANLSRPINRQGVLVHLLSSCPITN